MPMLKKRAGLPEQWPLFTGAGTGQNSKDFYLFGYSPEYNEHVARRNPPAEEYSHVLHYCDYKQHRVCRVPDRLSKLWWSEEADVAYAVGNPEEVIEIRSSGCTGIAMEGLPGVLHAIWGTEEDHMFACGLFNGFALYRHLGVWQQLKMPKNMNLALHHIVGFNEHDIYFVGQNGLVLHFDGHSLQPLEVPTTRTLLSAALVDHKHLCISGYGGVLLYGNKQGWRVIPSGTDKPIYSVARFRNGICFPTDEGVWFFDGRNAPRLLVEQPAGWVNGLGDAITLSNARSTWLFDGDSLVELDTLLRDPTP